MELFYYGALTLLSLAILTISASALGWLLHLKYQQDVEH